jgi:hypothetical protein
MVGGVDLFGSCGSVDLRIPESSLFNRSLHSTFEKFGSKNYATPINNKFISSRMNLIFPKCKKKFSFR